MYKKAGRPPEFLGRIYEQAAEHAKNDEEKSKLYRLAQEMYEQSGKKELSYLTKTEKKKKPNERQTEGELVKKVAAVIIISAFILFGFLFITKTTGYAISQSTAPESISIILLIMTALIAYALSKSR